MIARVGEVPGVGHKAAANVALRMFDHVTEEELVRLLMLLPEPVRKEVARTVWFDASDRKRDGLPRVYEMARVHELDDRIAITAEELYQGLIIVGYPEIRAQSRAIIHRGYEQREARGTVLPEKVRLLTYGGDWRMSRDPRCVARVRGVEEEANTPMNGGE